MRTKTETETQKIIEAELLFQKRLAETYAKVNKICAQIYIARNISLSEKDVVSALAEIDRLYREENHN